MAKFRLILTVLITAGLALVLWLQNSFNRRLRAENETLRQAIAELKQANEASAPVASDDPAAKAQLDELLKLRGEVTQLRQQTNQIAGLKDANQKLISSMTQLEASRTNTAAKKVPPEALLQDIHPKATWSYRGYGTPDATMESILSAMINGDKATCLAGFSPDMRDEIEKQFEKAVTDIKADDKAEFRILGRQSLSDDEMVLSFYLTRQKPNGDVEEHSEKTVFDKIDGAWQVTKKHPPDN